MICIRNGQLILYDKIVKSNLYIEGNKIVEISNREPIYENVIEANGLYVSPGFIDVHTHGRSGSDVMYSTYEDLNNISLSSAKSGVTSFLATTMTLPIDEISLALNNIAEHKDDLEGAKVLGIHLEGPYLNKKRCGSQNTEHFAIPSIEHFESVVGMHEQLIKKVTLAPEIENAMAFTNYLHNKGIVVSIGHSDATYDEVLHAVRMGITSATHTFNAMSQFHQRSPGVLGAVLLNDNIYAELILDEVLTNIEAGELLIRVKGVDHIVLITDSFEATSLEDGEYYIGDQKVYLNGGIARLSDGTLAASTLSMNEALRNVMEIKGVTLTEAVRMASYNPAKHLNCKDIGELKVGNKADIIIFDETIEIQKVMIDGKMIYIAENN